MCGRFARSTTSEQFAALVGSEPLGELRPRYNVCPTQRALIARELDGRRELAELKWGLVPHWSKDQKSGAKMINARAETVSSKPAYRDAFKYRRCLVAADGWYEWKVTPAGKVPMVIHQVSSEGEIVPFFFAGLWASWRDKAAPDADSLETFTILTRDAAPQLVHIHDRMPLVLPPSAYSMWLDREVTDSAAANDVLGAAVLDGYSAYPVSTRVNSPRNDDAACMEAVNPA